MTPDEYRAWADIPSNIRDRTTEPCYDCTAEFAREMRAESRCNGEPGVGFHSFVDEKQLHLRELWREASKRRREKLATA